MAGFIFDMDGTILHTLPDLALAANEALERMGFPTRSYDEINTLMGQGSNHLLERCCPDSAAPEQKKQAWEIWRSIYMRNAYANTEPFPGVVEAVQALRARGAKTAILSNKFDDSVQVLARQFFPGVFDVVRGEIPPTPRKPDPTALLQVLDELRVDPSAAVYVGDTNVDVQLAENAGVALIGVSWGYDTASPMRKDGMVGYIHAASDLLQFA